MSECEAWELQVFSKKYLKFFEFSHHRKLDVVDIDTIW